MEININKLTKLISYAKEYICIYIYIYVCPTFENRKEKSKFAFLQ